MSGSIQTLVAMGFPQRRALAALVQANDDLDRALDLLANEEFAPTASDDPSERLARALQLQMRDEEFAKNAQREADDEALAMAMAKQMRLDEQSRSVPAPLFESESYSAAPHPPPSFDPPDDGLTKKQRSNRRKALKGREKRDELREVSRTHEHRGAQL